jgi:hypothetical protein
MLKFASTTRHRANCKKGEKPPFDNRVHPLPAIEGGCGQKQVDGIADRALEIVAGQTKVIFQMTCDRFNGAAASKIFLRLCL